MQVHEKRAFAFIIMNVMTVQQVIKIEYTLLKYINLVKQSGIIVGIDFVPGKTWQKFKFTSGSASFLEKPKQSDAGVSYTQEVKCNITLDNVETLSMVNKLEHSDVVIKIMYNSGEWKVIGIPGNPVKTSAELEVAKSGLFKVSFQCDSIYRTRFLKA